MPHLHDYDGPEPSSSISVDGHKILLCNASTGHSPQVIAMCDTALTARALVRAYDAACQMDDQKREIERLRSALSSIMDAHGPGTLATDKIYENAVIALHGPRK